MINGTKYNCSVKISGGRTSRVKSYIYFDTYSAQVVSNDGCCSSTVQFQDVRWL